MVCIAPILAIVSFVAILVSVNTIFRSVVLLTMAIARMRAPAGKLILVTAGVRYTIVPAGGNRIATVVMTNFFIIRFLFGFHNKPGFRDRFAGEMVCFRYL